MRIREVLDKYREEKNPVIRYLSLYVSEYSPKVVYAAVEWLRLGRCRLDTPKTVPTVPARNNRWINYMDMKMESCILDQNMVGFDIIS